MAAGLNDQLKNGALLAARCVKSAAAAMGERATHAPASAAGKKGNRGVDVRRFRRRYVALEVMYIGWNYHGFTAQFASAKPAADAAEIRAQLLRDEQHPTVEGAIFRALRRTRLVDEDDSLHGISYSRCGRTDKGVSALGQVIALRLRSRQLLPTAADALPGPDGADRGGGGGGGGSGARPGEPGAPPAADIPPAEEIDYVRTLNTHLPSEIRILGWCDVPDDFHARFSCSWRQYKYLFTFDARGPGGPAVDIGAMQAAARMLEGEHDFRNFCKPDVENVHSFERRILSAEIRRESDAMYSLNVRGSAFLYNQVRCIMAILMMVGKREEEPEIVRLLLDVRSTPRKPAYAIADPEQLILFSVGYEAFEMRWNRPQKSTASTLSMLMEAQRSVSLRNALLASCHETVGRRRGAPAADPGDADARPGPAGDGDRGGEAAGAEEEYDPCARIATTVTAASLGRSVNKHVPLMKRPVEPSVEEKREKQRMRTESKARRRGEGATAEGDA